MSSSIHNNRQRLYALTFLVWNNLLSLFIAFALRTSEDINFFALFACILVISHVTSLICLASVEIFGRFVSIKSLYVSYIVPVSIAIIPGLIIGFYASKLFAFLVGIDWQPSILSTIGTGTIFAIVVLLLNIFYFNWIHSVRAQFQKELELKTTQATSSRD